VIFTLKVQLLFNGIIPPVKDKVVLPAVGDHDPPQFVTAAGVEAICRPEGRVSVKETPVKALDALGLDKVKVNVDTPFTAMGSGENDFKMAGGLRRGQPQKTTSSIKNVALDFLFPEPSTPILNVVVLVPVDAA
jgi:hypothetical protein